MIIRQSFRNPDCFDAHADHLPQQADDGFRIVGPIRVGADTAPLILARLSPVDNARDSFHESDARDKFPPDV
jgi:hypothetical protein